MPTPNFEDAPDGSSSINHTGSTFSAGDMTDMYNAAVRSPVNFEITENPFLPAPIPPPNQNTARPSRRLPRRRGASDPDAAIRKDPNAWSMREAVELCKLLEVVLPEAGFHIALTGGLLYKEGRRKDCDLMFYQIRQVEPNYEVLWKYLTVAGVIRSPSYPENGWLVKATYRGKAIDCLFPNAKKVKKAEGAPKGGYIFTPPPPPPAPVVSRPGFVLEPSPGEAEAFLRLRQEEIRRESEIIDAAIEADREIERRTGIVDPTSEARARMAAPPTIREGHIINPAWEAGAPVLVRHNDGAPILYRRSPDAPGPYDPLELLATPAPAPICVIPEVPWSQGELIDAAVAAAPIPVRQSVYRPCNPAELLANPAPTPIPPPPSGLLSETERRLEDAEAVRTTREEF